MKSSDKLIETFTNTIMVHAEIDISRMVLVGVCPHIRATLTKRIREIVQSAYDSGVLAGSLKQLQEDIQEIRKIVDQIP